MKDVETRPTDEEFYEELAKFFARFIFKTTNVDIVEKILCALLVHKVFTFVKLWGKNLPSLL